MDTLRARHAQAWHTVDQRRRDHAPETETEPELVLVLNQDVEYRMRLLDAGLLN